jgi:hypothetical protein
MILELIVGFAIFVFALFDLKERAVPSFLTTTVILALLLIQPQNLPWGVSAFTFGWLLYEFDFLGGRFFGGLADVKVVTIIGLMIGSLSQFAVMMIMTTGLSVILSMFLYYKNNKKIPEEIPFIPVLFLVYLATMIAGGVF